MSQKYHDIASLSKEELEIYLNELENEIKSVGNYVHLTNLNLQNARKKQQRTVDELITIAKTLHVAAMVLLNEKKV